MANTIVFKEGDGAPDDAGDGVRSEPLYDYTNHKLYISDDNAATPKEVGSETYLPLIGGALTGNLTTNALIDTVDIATRDGVLTSTTTTANAALPKAGGTMSGSIAMANADLNDIGRINFTTAGTASAFYDEDNMATNSSVGLASQQSIKAYVDDTANHFYLSQTFYSRISTPNLYIMNRTGATHTTGGTSASSFDCEALLHGAIYIAGEASTLVGARGWIGTGGTSTTDLKVSIITTDAYTSDQTGTISATDSAQLSQGGAVAQNDAYYVADGAINQALTAGQAVMIGISIGGGTNQYVQGSITLDFKLG